MNVRAWNNTSYKISYVIEKLQHLNSVFRLLLVGLIFTRLRRSKGRVMYLALNQLLKTAIVKRTTAFMNWPIPFGGAVNVRANPVPPARRYEYVDGTPPVELRRHPPPTQGQKIHEAFSDVQKGMLPIQMIQNAFLKILASATQLNITQNFNRSYQDMSVVLIEKTGLKSELFF